MINSLAPGRQNGSQGPSSASLSDSGVVAVESCPWAALSAEDDDERFDLRR